MAGSFTSCAVFITYLCASKCKSIFVFILWASSTWWCTRCSGTDVFWETSVFDCLLRHSRWKDDLRPDTHTPRIFVKYRKRRHLIDMYRLVVPTLFNNFQERFLSARVCSPREVGQRKTLLGDCQPPPPLLSSTCSPSSMGVNCLHVSSWYTSLLSTPTHKEELMKDTPWNDFRGEGCYVVCLC